jgi:amino acid transporter
VSSAFDFASNFFPLSSTAAGYSALGNASTVDPTATLNGASLERHKTLTYTNGLSLVVGLIIGSGIFSSPAQVNMNAGSPGASLLVWLFAGILAWTGAASYAELGGAIPLNGGSQAYLSKIFGEWAGFLFTWSAVCVLRPGSAAIIAIICGEYLVRAVVGANTGDVSPWVNKVVALTALIAVTLLNCISTKLGMRSANAFMILKFLALLGVMITGIVVAVTGYSWHGDANKEWKTNGWFDGTSHDISEWAVALYAGLWAFDGWDNVRTLLIFNVMRLLIFYTQVNYVAGEFVNPSRDIPRVIHSSLLIVIISYLCANLSYFFVLPSSVINSTNTVAVAFGQQVFGAVGALLLALAVSGSCFGALNAQTFTSGRLVYAAGKEGYLPEFFSRIGFGRNIAIRMTSSGSNLTNRPNRFMRFISDDTGIFYTPINAMALNALLTSGYIVVGEFATLLTFCGVAGYTFYFSTVLGLIILRVREPDLERPYKTWITTPIIFCCVSLFLLSRAVFARPDQTLIVVAFVLAGIPVYFWRVKRRNPKDLEKSSSWRFWKRWGRT